MSKKKFKHHKIIGRVPIPKKLRQSSSKSSIRYSFRDKENIGELNFVEQLMLSSKIENEYKDEIRKNIIIDGTSVSNYFFEGTDQEYWDLKKDFPNLAPPFNKFFIFHEAPEKIVSSIHGIHNYDRERRAYAWGCFFEVQDHSSWSEVTSSDREKAKQRLESLLPLMAKQVQKIFEKYPYREKSSDKISAFVDNLPINERASIYQAKSFQLLYELMQENKWEEIISLSEQGSTKWTIYASLYIKFHDMHAIPCLGPLWNISFSLYEDGSIVLLDDEEPLITNYVPNKIKPFAENMAYQENISPEEALQKIKNEMFNYIKTSLLTICFMHCKNVILTKETNKNCTHKTSKKLPAIEYHTLDIHPMKEILRKEGKSEEIGLQKALHICRGHFRTYSEEKPLFGKVAGTFWIPQHARGSKEHGRIAKNYSIKI